MTDLEQSAYRATLTGMTTRFLDANTTADERQTLRRAARTPQQKLAFEQHYVDGDSGEEPLRFIRHTLAALFMTGGFTSRDSAQQILMELREIADQHQLDFETLYEDVRSLPGARRSRSTRRRLALVNVGLFAVLMLGTFLIHRGTAGLTQAVLQLGLLVGVAALQLWLLYRHLG